MQFTGKYGTDDLNLNKYTHAIKINYANYGICLVIYMVWKVSSV